MRAASISCYFITFIIASTTGEIEEKLDKASKKFSEILEKNMAHLSEENRREILSSIPDVAQLMQTMFTGQMRKRREENVLEESEDDEYPNFDDISRFFNDEELEHFANYGYFDEEEEEYIDENGERYYNGEEEGAEEEEEYFNFEDELNEETEGCQEPGFCYANNN